MITVKKQVKRAQDCNIGPKGIKRRWRMGYVHTIIFVIYALVLWYVDHDPVWRLLLFIPAFFAALGYLQAYFQFCVNFGFRGKNKILDNEPLAMQPENHKRKSQWRALKITIYAFVIAAFATAVVYYQ